MHRPLPSIEISTSTKEPILASYPFLGLPQNNRLKGNPKRWRDESETIKLNVIVDVRKIQTKQLMTCNP